MENENYRRCSRGLWDTSIPGIKFDEEGVSNYCRQFEDLIAHFRRDDESHRAWQASLDRIKKQGKGKRYDCLIGLSGGTDSSYLLHLAVREWGLRPLAMYLDNGWSTAKSVKNIKLVTGALGVDLVSEVIDYREVKAILVAYMRAGIPWIDGPTDRAIKSSLFRTAAREDIKAVMVGTDFRSEGKQPDEWTHNDARLFKSIAKQFASIPIKSYPNMGLIEQTYYTFFKRIKRYQPFYHLQYTKQNAIDILRERYNWEYYGGHHHENLFTKFVITNWLPNKFSIDKRIITLSAQVMMGARNREDAINELAHKPSEERQSNIDAEIVMKKLDLSKEEFEEIWTRPNRTFRNYPNYHDLYIWIGKNFRFLLGILMPTLPKMTIGRLIK